MKIKWKPAIPWWAWPWRSNRMLQGVVSGQLAEITGLHARMNEKDERLKASAAELNRLRDQLEACGRVRSELGSDNAKLRREVQRWRSATAAAVTDTSSRSAAVLADAEPEFVMVGLARGAGKRIQVSRDIKVTAFAMTEPDDPPSRFKIGAIMTRLIMIDKPTYAEALAHLATMWANEDREYHRQLPSDQPGHVIELE